MIAMALLCQPDLLIADEPTTALDVTIQAQILDLMRELKRSSNTAIILITHALGVVAGLCERVLVMYGGRIVEQAPVRQIFYDPQHPYTQGLLRSTPRLDEVRVAELRAIPGQPPNMQRLPSGCAFHDRCTWCTERTWGTRRRAASVSALAGLSTLTSARASPLFLSRASTISRSHSHRFQRKPRGLPEAAAARRKSASRCSRCC